jgi:DNA-binding MarR family transcriptional regulator
MDDKTRYNGGRALNAVYASKKLEHFQKSVLTFIGSQIDFCDFTKPYWISISRIMEALSLSRPKVQRVLKSLVESGYLKKEFRFNEKNKQQISNSYSLTSKIFDEYAELAEATPVSNRYPPSQGGHPIDTPPVSNRCPPGYPIDTPYQDSNNTLKRTPSSVCSLSAPARDNDHTHKAPENKILDVEELVETYWSNETPRGEFVTRKAMAKQFKRMINGYDPERVKAVLEECFAENHYRPLAWDLALFSQILVARVGGFNIDTS